MRENFIPFMHKRLSQLAREGADREATLLIDSIDREGYREGFKTYYQNQKRIARDEETQAYPPVRKQE